MTNIDWPTFVAPHRVEIITTLEKLQEIRDIASRKGDDRFDAEFWFLRSYNVDCDFVTGAVIGHAIFEQVVFTKGAAD